MSNDLPEFKTRNFEYVSAFVRDLLTSHQQEDLYFRDLQVYPDGHYRASFALDYFKQDETDKPPTKSQWNSLKKKFKRHDKDIFVFKEHGVTSDGLGYVDFGYFAHPRSQL